MKKNAFRISEKALEDLDIIWVYTFENWSEKQANRYYTLIINEIHYLAENFDSGKNLTHIKLGYRSSKVKSHLIFYRKSADGVLEVVRILHQQMDIENRI